MNAVNSAGVLTFHRGDLAHLAVLAGVADVLAEAKLALSAVPPPMVMPGSFNPMHTGHTRLARAAEDIRQEPVTFEISVTNVDKPPLAGEAMVAVGRQVS